VLEEMTDWAVPLDETYAAILIDAILVKVGDGKVAKAVLRSGRGN
jgi:putative transposase